MFIFIFNVLSFLLQYLYLHQYLYYYNDLIIYSTIVAVKASYHCTMTSFIKHGIYIVLKMLTMHVYIELYKTNYHDE